ncbi:MAG TPA: iron ABC transporter permease [Bryobacteraceae bacterium]|nr:iron ABC transporter permease [Bryobacteraceae bacterium]
MKTAFAKPAGVRLFRALILLAALLLLCALLALWAGTEKLDLTRLRADPMAQTLFFRLRLPRVVMAALVGSTLAVVGAALQALFRNPLADPFTLGVSGGGAVGASIAIALGWSARLSGIPLVFVAAFCGAMAAVLLVYRIARTGTLLLPGALLLAGVVVNLIASAVVLTVTYMTDSARALEILRWMVGSLEVVGFDIIVRMLLFLAPCWIALLALSRELHLLAMGEEAAGSLGVNVQRCETWIHLLCSLMVGVTVAVGGAIGFVGLIVPHAVRLLFGEDLRIVLPGSLLLGAAFLIAADTVARTALSPVELPVGAVTALLGGPAFLWLLYRRQRYSAL